MLGVQLTGLPADGVGADSAFKKAATDGEKLVRAELDDLPISTVASASCDVQHKARHGS